ncbi:DegV family protein [Nocardioides yefusunii]|uniref:DegV family protein n=1 Tax=Nocardioides yefusunii TaxID=2500546 RepID=A0ABW1QW03_9ACTN|nr:DegV family protein [Nocardioides yefusunii]
MGARTVVVTDSTACLPADLAEQRGIVVVPLQVVIDDVGHDEGTDEVSPTAVAAALKGGSRVTTSRVTPETLTQLYRRLAAEGAEAIVSVHISGMVSGTYDSAVVAGRNSPIPVHTVDTRQVSANTGYAALAASDVLAAGGTALEAARAARRRAALSHSYFYVDTLEYLRRGGRVNAASAFLGGALAVKPLLTLREGKVTSLEKVRTAGKALARLEELIVTAAGEQQVELCIAHLDSPERAEKLAERLRERLADNLGDREVRVAEVGGVVGAHVGPGMVAGALAPVL